MRSLWLWLPDEFMVLVIAIVGIALMVRLMSGRAAAGILGLIVLSLLAGPVVEGMFDGLSEWVTAVVLLIVVLVMVRGLVSLLLGRGATDHFIGSLAATAVVGCLRLFFFPFKLLGRALVRGSR